MSDRIRVLLADDHELVSRMLESLLQSEPDLQVVATVSNSEDAITQAIQHQPDVVVLDIDMPGLCSFEAAKTISTRCPNARIIFLSAFADDRYIKQALAVGALGYLTKTESPQTVVKAIRTIASGGICFSQHIQERITFDSGGPTLARTAETQVSKLTQREIEVLQEIALGFSKKQIAKRLCISVNTVDNHTSHLMTKLDIHDRVALTRWAIREGLVQV